MRVVINCPECDKRIDESEQRCDLLSLTNYDRFTCSSCELITHVTATRNAAEYAICSGDKTFPIPGVAPYSTNRGDSGHLDVVFEE